MEAAVDVREIAVTALQLVGLLLLVAAGAVWAATAVALPLGLGVAGAGILGVSALSDVLSRPRRRRKVTR